MRCKAQEGLPWSVLNKDQAEGKVKIPSTPTTTFIQCTTEELDQLINLDIHIEGNRRVTNTQLYHH